MLDPILTLRISDLERRRFLKEARRASEASRSAPNRPRWAFLYDVWLARLDDLLVSIGMSLKARTAWRYSDSRLKVARR